MPEHEGVRGWWSKTRARQENQNMHEMGCADRQEAPMSTEEKEEYERQAFTVSQEEASVPVIRPHSANMSGNGLKLRGQKKHGREPIDARMKIFVESEVDSAGGTNMGLDMTSENTDKIRPGSPKSDEVKTGMELLMCYSTKYKNHEKHTLQQAVMMITRQQALLTWLASFMYAVLIIALITQCISNSPAGSNFRNCM